LTWRLFISGKHNVRSKTFKNFINIDVHIASAIIQIKQVAPFASLVQCSEFGAEQLIDAVRTYFTIAFKPFALHCIREVYPIQYIEIFPTVDFKFQSHPNFFILSCKSVQCFDSMTSVLRFSVFLKEGDHFTKPFHNWFDGSLFYLHQVNNFRISWRWIEIEFM
jgi:hypothetical protein